MLGADLAVALPDGRHGGRAGFDLDFAGIAQVAVRHLADRFGHGGRKQGDLPFWWSLFENPIHIFDEAHPQHLVGFVQHYGSQFCQR